MTWSVKDGGRLCKCGHMKCEHENGSGECWECTNEENCRKYADRAPESVNV